MFTPIPGHSDYGIARNGEVRQLSTGNLVAPCVDAEGVMNIHLPNSCGPSFKKRVALLVATLYVPVPAELKNLRTHVMYKDQNKSNVHADNLYWISYRDSQKFYYTEKCLRYLREHHLPGHLEYTEKCGLAPNPIESTTYPGYYHVPFSLRPMVVNHDGDFIDLLNDTPCTVNQRSQYKMVTIHNGNKARAYPVHRILAALFVERPERHRDKSIEDLDVNHIDGDKHNNALTNIEWVTHAENIEFARQTGLFNNNFSVEARNIKTGEISRYYSLSRCANAHQVNNTLLSLHLQTEFTGMVPYNGHVFRKAECENDPWPEVLFPERVRGGLGIDHDLIAIHQTTNEKVIFPNIQAFAAHCGLERYIVKNHIARKGYGSVFKDWFIWPLADWIRGGGLLLNS